MGQILLDSLSVDRNAELQKCRSPSPSRQLSKESPNRKNLWTTPSAAPVSGDPATAAASLGL